MHNPDPAATSTAEKRPTVHGLARKILTIGTACKKPWARGFSLSLSATNKTIMILFTKYFFSQKLGRASGTVQINDDRSATVEITFTEGNEPTWRCELELHRLCSAPEKQGLEELALRIAIANLYRHVTRPPSAEPELISLNIRPWIGDFRESACDSGSLAVGGVNPAQERRDSEQSVEELVASGIEMVSLNGVHAARSFLRYASVPPSVIRRVLSKSTHRRKTSADPG